MVGVDSKATLRRRRNHALPATNAKTKLSEVVGGEARDVSKAKLRRLRCCVLQYSDREDKAPWTDAGELADGSDLLVKTDGVS